MTNWYARLNAYFVVNTAHLNYFESVVTVVSKRAPPTFLERAQQIGHIFCQLSAISTAQFAEFKNDCF